MRVLCSAVPLEGHVRPVLRIAQALALEGHDVLFATGPEYQERVRATGVRPVVTGPAFQDALDATERDPELAERPPYLRTPWAFCRIIAPAKLPEIERILANWRPDLVIYECTDMAAPIAAIEAGIPRVLQGWGVVPVPGGGSCPSPLRVPELWKSRGLEARDTSLFGNLYLHPMPPSLEPDALAPVGRLQPMRLETSDAADSTLPPWTDMLSRSGRPVVYVGLGTFSDFAKPELFRTILDGLARLDVEVVATVGRHNDPQRIGEYPDRVHVEHWLPLAPLLPYCSLVVCHAGSGTLLASLAAGLPLVLLPLGADHFLNAQATERAGVAQVLLREALTPETVAATVESTLKDASYRQAAARVRGEIEAMPAPSAVIPVLEELVVRHPIAPDMVRSQLPAT